MAQVDYFLKIEGVEGESTDKKYPSHIEPAHWSLNEHNGAHFSSDATGGGAGKVHFSDFAFSTKALSKASVPMALGCACGTHFKKAELIARKAGDVQQEYFKITMTDVIVSSYQVGGGANVVAVDNVSLAFAKVEFEYKDQKTTGGAQGGKVGGGWDLTKNVKV